MLTTARAPARGSGALSSGPLPSSALSIAATLASANRLSNWWSPVRRSIARSTFFFHLDMRLLPSGTRGRRNRAGRTGRRRRSHGRLRLLDIRQVERGERAERRHTDHEADNLTEQREASG